VAGGGSVDADDFVSKRRLDREKEEGPVHSPDPPVIRGDAE